MLFRKGVGDVRESEITFEKKSTDCKIKVISNARMSSPQRVQQAVARKGLSEISRNNVCNTASSGRSPVFRIVSATNENNTVKKNDSMPKTSNNSQKKSKICVRGKENIKPILFNFDNDTRLDSNSSFDSFIKKKKAEIIQDFKEIQNIAEQQYVRMANDHCNVGVNICNEDPRLKISLSSNSETNLLIESSKGNPQSGVIPPINRTPPISTADSSKQITPISKVDSNSSLNVSTPANIITSNNVIYTSDKLTATLAKTPLEETVFSNQQNFSFIISDNKLETCISPLLLPNIENVDHTAVSMRMSPSAPTTESRVAVTSCLKTTDANCKIVSNQSISPKCSETSVSVNNVITDNTVSIGSNEPDQYTLPKFKCTILSITDDIKSPNKTSNETTRTQLPATPTSPTTPINTEISCTEQLFVSTPVSTVGCGLPDTPPSSGSHPQRFSSEVSPDVTRGNSSNTADHARETPCTSSAVPLSRRNARERNRVRQV